MVRHFRFPWLEMIYVLSKARTYNMVKQTEVAPEWRDPASAARMVGCGGRSRERAIGN